MQPCSGKAVVQAYSHQVTESLVTELAQSVHSARCFESTLIAWNNVFQHCAILSSAVGASGNVVVW